jgi:5-oxoprolinase (ATP-hydrolysing)
MEGGESATMGRNTWIKQRRKEDGDLLESEDKGPRHVNIGGKATVFMGKGDRLLIETPGGGGWGLPSNAVVDVLRAPEPLWEARGSFAERAAAQASF